MAFVLKKDREWLVTHAHQTLNRLDRVKFERLCKRRLAHTPLAYLIHQKYFYGRAFFVDTHVLIPRPETEALVDEALKHAKGAMVWDVGTGSGAIAISLANRYRTVIASDMSNKALRVAKQNAKHHKANITFIQEYLLGPKVASLLRRKMNTHLIVVANLPYLPISDQKKLDASVVKYEPALALFTKDNGQWLNKKLLTQLSRLHRPMTILLEYDSPQTKTLQTFAKKIFPKAKIAIIKDPFGRNRILNIICSVPQTSNHRS